MSIPVSRRRSSQSSSPSKSTNPSKSSKSANRSSSSGRSNVKTKEQTSKEISQTLKDLGKEDLTDLFKGYKQRTAPNKKRTPPADQRVGVAVTERERAGFDQELISIKKAGDRISMSQFIRNRALSSVDIGEWREIAEDALKELDAIKADEKEMRARRRQLEVLFEEDLDEEDIIRYEIEMKNLNDRIGKLYAQSQRRKYKLTGRMTMIESETVKWRSSRLCISQSDFLRMVIFDLKPNSTADSHMSYDARQRFYISIINVAENGWGEPPKVRQCSNCEANEKENERLRSRIRELEAKVRS